MAALPRPASVTVFGILNIVFGALGLLCVSFMTVGLALGQGLDALGASDGYKVWVVVTCGVGFLATVWLLALGIGLLNQKGWARAGAVAYGYLMVVFRLLDVVITVVCLATGALSPKSEMLPGMIGGLVGSFIHMVYPILLIVFMTRPRAVASCVR